MKRIFLLLSITFILGAGLSSCSDEASEVTPNYEFKADANADSVGPSMPPKERD